MFALTLVACSGNNNDEIDCNVTPNDPSCNNNDNNDNNDDDDDDDNGTVTPPKEYDVDLSTLDFDGQEIIFYTHVVNEDNPFAEGYVHADGEEYREHLTNLQETYNFTLKFQSWTDYENRVNDVANHVLGSNSSAIIRAPELEFMLDLISAGYLSNFTHVADALKDEYAVNDWQIGAGTVNNNVFAIQNKDGVPYVDLMVYNLDLINEAGLDKTPSELWIEGNWTMDTMEDYLRQLRLELDTSIYPLAITPYHIGIYAPAANGTRLVSDEGDLSLLNTSILDVIYSYKNWYDYNYILPMEFSNGYILRHSVANAWQRQEAVIGKAMMWQLSGFSQSVSFEYGVVPYPQAEDATRDDYYSPLNPGDLQMVTIGSNSDEVSTILFLINEFHKDALDTGLDDYCVSIDENMDQQVCESVMNVQEYLRLSNEEEIARAEEIFTFLQGNSEENAIRANDLAYLNGEIQYVQAVQDYFRQGGSPRNYIDAIIPTVQENIRRMLEAIENSLE
jgi:hypothetical protein